MNTIGLILALIALVIGSFFFLYSVRYYIIVAMVLAFSRRGATRRPIKEKDKKDLHRVRGVLYSLFRQSFLPRGRGNGPNGQNNNNFKGNNFNGLNGFNNNGLNNNGLFFQGDKDFQEWQPFISIHIPFYNEKKVANRILAALTSLDYENYEIVVVDDSTDETLEILKKWKLHPKVKVFHRDARTGFKGGALKVALEKTDPQADFAVVFDADFVPYPDTLKQFLRYFYATAGRNYKESKIAAVQGYQWHVLNKNENWITRGVRTEFAGSYVIERPATEIAGLIKLIAGSVYMVRTDLLREYGWGTSITEDFQLTLRLYADGYKVIYTPYIQSPSECVSTIKRLVRQRMRWAEGHTHNVKKMFWKILRSPYLRKREKAEFFYLAPYYLQSALFVTGTLAWFVSDAVFNTHLPFWTALWGWSLVLTNLFSLPLVNGVGIFLEEGEQRDYLGIFSFVLLSYIVAPFQAYAALKGLFEKEEGHWFRTPKTGKITDAFFRSRFRRWFGALFPRTPEAEEVPVSYLKLTSSYRTFDDFQMPSHPLPWLARATIVIFLIITVNLFVFARNVPQVLASQTPADLWLSNDASTIVTSPANWQLSDGASDELCDISTSTKNAKSTAWFIYRPGVGNSATTGDPTAATAQDNGWTFDTPFGTDGSIGQSASAWTFYLRISDNAGGNTGNVYINVFRVAASSGSITSSTKFFGFQGGTDIWTGAVQFFSETNTPASQPYSFTSDEKYLHVEYWSNSDNGAGSSAAASVFGVEQCGTSAQYPRIIAPAATIPEKIIILLAIIPFLPFLVRKLQTQRAGSLGLL